MLISVLKYNFTIYKKSHKYVLPILILMVYMSMTYTIKPLDITGTMIVSAIMIFIIMSIIGYTYCDGDDTAAEQILILRIKSHFFYWLYKILFISVIGLFFSLLAVLIPILLNIINSNTLFKPELTFSDLIVSLIFHILLGIMGGILGMLMQPRIIENRKSALLLNIFIVLISIIKYPVIKEFPYTKYIIWLSPPVGDFSNTFMTLKHFTFGASIIPALFIIIYIFIESYLLIYLMKKNLY